MERTCSACHRIYVLLRSHSHSVDSMHTHLVSTLPQLPLTLRPGRVMSVLFGRHQLVTLVTVDSRALQGRPLNRDSAMETQVRDAFLEAQIDLRGAKHDATITEGMCSPSPLLSPTLPDVAPSLHVQPTNMTPL